MNHDALTVIVDEFFLQMQKRVGKKITPEMCEEMREQMMEFAINSVLDDDSEDML